MLWYNNACISNDLIFQDSTLELFTEYDKKKQNNTDGHYNPTFLNKSSTQLPFNMTLSSF